LRELEIDKRLEVEPKIVGYEDQVKANEISRQRADREIDYLNHQVYRYTNAISDLDRELSRVKKASQGKAKITFKDFKKFFEITSAGIQPVKGELKY
jgi:chromosome segregation ATPase